MNYRPDIDGLRAIAVLAVIVFHLNENWLPSGFLGVDIFFVISGFLITTIIYQEILTKRFSFFHFYQRRVKRILPVFSFVILVTSLLSYWLFLPEDLNRYLHSVRYAWLFASNVYFAQQTDYFDISISEKPLLHIWSLSVEEQFYFAFPFILYFLYKKNSRYIIRIILGLIFLSIFSTFIPIGNYNSYFLTHIRAYELLIGSLFAVCVIQNKSFIAINNGKYYAWLLLIIIIGCLFLPKDYFYTEGYLERIVICLSTAMLIIINVQKNSISKFLSMRLMVGIGLISYSLYLWHWVVLALLRYIYMSYYLPDSAMIFAVCSMFILAIFTYYLIEKPIKKISKFNKNYLIGCAFVYFSILFFITVFIQQMNEHDKPNHNIEYHELSWDKNICHNHWKISCKQGDVNQQSTVLVIGDSHAGQYNRFINEVGKHEKWAADVISADGCAFVYQDNKINHVIGRTTKNCSDFREYVSSIIDRYKKIVIIQRWSGTLQNAGVYQGELNRTLQYLLSKNKKIYLFQDNPDTGFLIQRKYHLQQQGINIAPFMSDDMKKRIEATHSANQQIKKIVAQYPQITWIDITHYIPKDFMINGLPIYRDFDHINPYGAEQLAKRFILANEKLLLEKE